MPEVVLWWVVVCKGCQLFWSWSRAMGPKKAMVMKSILKKQKGEAADDKKVPKAKAAPYKRPASKPVTPMCLEEKMELFAKSKQQNVAQFLDQLSDAQRQALWQRFSRARDAPKDEDTTAMRNSGCKGKNSDPMKKKLLGIFLNEGANLKNSTAWQKEKVTWSQSTGI